MKKGLQAGEFLWYAFFALIILAFVSVFYTLFLKGASAEVVAFENTKNELRMKGIYSKILSSPKCLSTGEVGILNDTLLTDKDGQDLSCVNLPNFKTYTEVNIPSEGTEYNFGNSFDKGAQINFTVGVKKTGGEIKPGKLKVKVKRK